MSWTALLVRERLVEAADTQAHILAERVGPGKLKSLWPVFAQDRNDAYGYGQVQVRYIPNAAAISRAEEVRAWINALVDEDKARQIVWARASCEAGKRSFAGWCRKNRVPRRSAYRLTGLIHERVALSLCKASINLRYPDYGRVAQHEGIEGGQIDSLSISASPRSFMEDDARPIDDPEARDMAWSEKQAERRRKILARYAGEAA
jgi:hypothetical protein